MVNFRSTLATSQDTNVVRVEVILQQGGQGRAVLGGMHDAWILGKTWGHLGLTPNGKNHLACLSYDDLACRKVTGKNAKVVHHRAVGVRLSRNDFCHILSVGHHIRESLRTPPHIIFELQSGRKEGSQVGEVDQSTFLLEVIEESEAAAGVTEGSQVFDEGNLHPGAGNQHPRMPGELLLPFEEADLGLEVGVGARGSEGWVQRIVQSNGNCQRGRSKPNAEEVVKLLLGGSLELGGPLRRRRLHMRHGVLLVREVDFRFP